jgi:hydrogenase maturation protein HypF
VPWDERLAPVEACRASERRLLADQLRSGAAVVPTSSMGRLFDVVSSLAGICQHATYEGQAAMALEAAASGAAASSSSRGRYRFSLDAESPLRIGWEPVVRAVAADALDGVGAAAIGLAFHEAVARLVADLAAELCGPGRARRLGLTGGVFQNVRLLRLVCGILEQQGVQVLTHRLVPPNDGGLSLGQAAIGAAGPQPDWT